MEIIHIEVEKINTAIIRDISNHHNQLSINTIEHGNFLAKQPTNLVLDINDIGLSTTTLQLQLKVLHTQFQDSIILFFYSNFVKPQVYVPKTMLQSSTAVTKISKNFFPTP